MKVFNQQMSLLPEQSHKRSALIELQQQADEYIRQLDTWVGAPKKEFELAREPVQQEQVELKESKEQKMPKKSALRKTPVLDEKAVSFSGIVEKLEQSNPKKSRRRRQSSSYITPLSPPQTHHSPCENSLSAPDITVPQDPVLHLHRHKHVYPL